MKRKTWILATLICLVLVCICAYAAADGLILRDEAGNILEDGAVLSGRAYYKIYVSGLPEGADALETGWTEDMNATAPDGWESEPRRLGQDNGGWFLSVIPDPFDVYDQEIMFARADSDDQNVRRIEIHYDRNEAGTVRPRITTGEDPQFGQEDYTLRWTGVNGAQSYFIKWIKPNGDYLLFGTDETEITLDGDATGTAGEYCAQVIPLVNGYFGRTSNERYFRIETPESDGRVRISADRLDENNDYNIRIDYDEAIFYYISAPGADEVRFVNGEWTDDIYLNENGKAEYFWMPGRNNWEGVRHYTVYAQARFGNEWATSNAIDLEVNVNGDIQGDFIWSLLNEEAAGGTTPSIPRNGLAEIEAGPMTGDTVDFYCAYLTEEGGGAWVADSHWIEANPDGPTTILMPVASCAPGTYEVHVETVKTGYRRKTSENTAWITVTDGGSYDPIIISMKPSFETREPLRIRAWYDNEQELQDAWMHVEICPQNEDESLGEPWYSEDGGFDFWENDFHIIYEGNYVLNAWICQHVGQENVQEVEGTRTSFTFFVDARDQLDEPSVTMTDRAWTDENQLAISIGEVEHADDYGWWLHREEDRENLKNDGAPEAGEQTIDICGLEPGIYWVEVDVSGRGYNASHVTKYLMLQDRNDTDLSGDGYYFSVSAETDGQGNLYATTDEGIRFIYFEPGAEQVQLFTSVNGELIQIEHAGGPGVQGWYAWDQSGTYTVYRQAKFSGDVWGEMLPVCEINVQSALDEPQVEIPEFVDAGQDVDITFHPIPNATSYSYWLSEEGNDTDIGISGSINSAINKATHRTIYWDQLTPNRVYRVYLDVYADGYFSGHTERQMYVLGDDDTTGSIWLNINPDDNQGMNDVGVGETFEVKAGAENAQDIFVRRGSDWDINRRYGEDYFQDTYCIDGPENVSNGYAAFTAFARVNESELLIRRGQVAVTGVDSAVSADPPTLTLDRTTVGRNEFLTATVTSSETGAYEYHVNIYDSEGNWRGDYRSDTTGVIRIPTGNLEEGTYRIGAWVRVHGKYSGDTGHDEQSGGWATVTITACTKAFRVSTNTVQVCEPMTVSICAPGAERIRFSSGYDRWDDENGWDTDNWYHDHISWEYAADTVTIRAEAMFSGRWEEIGSQQIIITKVGNLKEADLSGIPSTVPAGSDCTFSFPAVANAEFYDIEVWRVSDNEGWYERKSINGTGPVSFLLDGEFLQNPDEGYMMRVIAKGTGYNASERETTFVTVPETPGEHEITMTADRDEAESNNDQVRFTVEAEGASIVMVYHEGQWDWAPTDENGQAELEFGFNRNVLQPVWAKACYNQAYNGWRWEDFEEHNQSIDGLTFEGMSNIVNIQVHSRGETMMPDWAAVPEEIIWGELLPVEIGGEGNAETLHIRIRSEENDEIYFREIHERGTTTYLPTAMLTPGEEYWVSIDGVCSGYTWSHLNGEEGDFRFTVAAREETGAFMTSDRDGTGWVFTSEPYYVQMYAPGAIELMAAVEADPEYDVNAKWDGESGVSDRNGFWWDEAGEHTLNGYARYSAGGPWEWIGSVTLNVIDRNLEAPEIRTASVVDNSSDLFIDVLHVPFGNNYWLGIHCPGGENVYDEMLTADPEADYVTHDEENDRYWLTFCVPADTLADGENYWIDCHVDGAMDGMYGSSNSRMILVNNSGEYGIDGNIHLTVNKTRMPINEMFSIQVNASGAKAIRLRYGDQWRCYAGSDIRDELSGYQPYEEVLYAQACYDPDLELPEDMWDFDWEEAGINWGLPSQAIEMTFYTEGQAGEPDFVAPETIRRGEIMTISQIWPGDNANETHANILWNNPEDDFEDWAFGDDWVVWNENMREIHLNTSHLPGGEYWLAVDCSGIGYTGNRKWHPFTVTEDEDDPDGIVFSAPETVMLGEPLPVNVSAPGAWRIGFALDGDRWDIDEEGNYQWGTDNEWWFDNENIRWHNPADIGEHTIIAYVQYSEDGEWEQIERTVMVIDPNLAIPEIRAEDVVSNTTDLTITVPVVENGTDYHLAIHNVKRDDEESYKYQKDLEDSDADDEGLLVFTVPAGSMADGAYWIDCYVDTEKAGYRGSESHKAILVRNSTTDKDSRIHIDADSEQLINQEFAVYVSAEGAKAFLIHCGDHSWGCLADEEGNAEIRVSEYQAATETLYAQACYSDDPNLPAGFQWNYDWENAGIAWGYPSEETVQMHFYSYGPAGQAGFDAPITIRRGDVLTISNINLGDGANEAHANINENGPGQEEIQVYGYGWHGWDEGARTIYMSTSMLEVGRTYWLMVDNSGIGRENNRTWHEFAVVERDDQEENDVFFSVPEKVQAGCIVPINVYAPGAVKTGFGINLDAEEQTDENKYELIMDGDIAYNLTDYWWNETGTVKVTAYALFDGETEPVIIEKTVTICGPLSFDMSGLPGYFEVGQANATVEIPLPENAEGMSVSIHADWDGGRETLYQADNLTGMASFTIPSEWLTEDREIRIDWFAYAEGFEEVYGGTNIIIVPTAGNGATITLINENGEEGDLNNIQTNQGLLFRVSPTAGHTLTAVRFYEGHGYRWGGAEVNHENADELFEDDGSIIFWNSFNHNDDPTQMLSVFAEVRVDGSEVWQTTNCLRFTVKTPHGETGDYDFTDLTPITAVRGEVIEVEFTPVSYPEGEIHYWADVFTPDGYSFNPQTNWEGTTVMISTVNIPAGEYVIRGRAVKDTEPGWRWSESRSVRALTITEETPEMPAAQFRTPAGLIRIEEEAFAGIAAQTVEIGESVQWIENRAFADSNVKQVIIRNGGTWIDDHAFDGCGNGKITVYGQPESDVQRWAEWNLYAFYPIP